MLNKYVIFVFLCCLITGCSLTNSDARTPLNLPPPAPLKMKPVKWKVLKQDPSVPVTDKNIVIIGLTEESYKNLAKNFRDIVNYMSTQRKIIKIYKEYHETEQ
jgi:hypothetical protein